MPSEKTRDSNLSSITPAPHFYYSLIRICPLCVDKDSGDDKACCLQVEINEGCCLPLCFEDVTAGTSGDGKGGKNGKKYLVKSPKGMKGSKVPKVGGCPQREAVPSSRARDWSWRRACRHGRPRHPGCNQAPSFRCGRGRRCASRRAIAGNCS